MTARLHKHTLHYGLFYCPMGKIHSQHMVIMVMSLSLLQEAQKSTPTPYMHCVEGGGGMKKWHFFKPVGFSVNNCQSFYVLT